MIRGQLNARLEAMLRLKVIGASGAEAEVDAIIDTGFTGSLVLPASVIEQLGLVKRSGGTATLADGTVRHFETFGAELEWDGRRRKVVVAALGEETLAGMVLFAGHRICFDVEAGGQVEIEELSTGKKQTKPN